MFLLHRLQNIRHPVSTLTILEKKTKFRTWDLDIHVVVVQNAVPGQSMELQLIVLMLSPGHSMSGLTVPSGSSHFLS